ncbi:uncharacterized protein TNCV_2797361 [Trichonephila clavipes]|nr:uncharacterized protein TNCV_2797361 [Trichonephila clavipes]
MLPEPVRQVGLLYDRWRPHRSQSPQFRHGTGGKGNILQSPALVVSAAPTHRTFEPTDLTSTYSVCTRRIFGAIGHRTQALRSGVRCSNHWATHGPEYAPGCTLLATVNATPRKARDSTTKFIL